MKLRLDKVVDYGRFIFITEFSDIFMIEALVNIDNVGNFNAFLSEQNFDMYGEFDANWLINQVDAYDHFTQQEVSN